MIWDIPSLQENEDNWWIGGCFSSCLDWAYKEDEDPDGYVTDSDGPLDTILINNAYRALNAWKYFVGTKKLVNLQGHFMI